MSRYRDELPPDFDKPSVERKHARLYRIAYAVFWCFRILSIAALALLLLSATLALFSHSPAARPAFWSGLLAIPAAIATRRASLWLRGRSERLESLLSRHALQEREHREGLRARTEHDCVIDPTTWTPNSSEAAEWAHGEIRKRLPGDTVYRFSWIKGPTYGSSGYALERNGKIVAERIFLVS